MKVNTSSLKYAVFLYTVGNVFNKALNFILLPLYSHVITKEEFGIYSLFMSFYVLLGVVYQAGLGQGLTKFYISEENEERKKNIFSNIFSFAFISSLALTTILLFFNKQLSQVISGTGDYSRLVIFLLPALFLDNITYLILHLLRTRELVFNVTIYSTVSAIFNVLLNLYFVYYLQMGIEGIVLSQLISSAILILILLPFSIKHVKFNLDKNVLKPVIIFSLPFIIGGFLSVGIDVADRFILNAFLSKEALGEYSFAYRIGLIMNVFVISFRSAYTPRALNLYQKKQFNKNFKGFLLNYVIAASGITIGITILSFFLFNYSIFGIYVFNQDYAGSLYIVPIILLSYAFSGVSSLYSVYPYVSNKSSYFLFADGIGFLVNISFNLIFIPLWGLYGAAIANLISFACNALYLYIISYKKL